MSDSPTVVVPSPASRTGAAIDDEWTAIRDRKSTTGFAARTATLLVLGAMALGLLLLAALRRGPLAAQLDLTMGLLIGVWVVQFGASWRHRLRAWRTRRSVLRRYPWRETPARLVRGNPRHPSPLVVDAAGVLLRFAGMQWWGQLVIMRTGRIWLCGPDHRGRALVRLDGSLAHATVRVVDRLPAGATSPTGLAAHGPRPTDEPQLAGNRRHYARRIPPGLGLPLSQFAIGVVLAGVAVQARASSLVALGAFLALSQVRTLTRRVWSFCRSRPTMRLMARADRWTPLPGRVRTRGWRWRFAESGAARGELWLPDGSCVPIRLPWVSDDVVADIQASGTMYLAGEPTPGGRTVVGVPGYGYFSLVRIGRVAQVQSGPRLDQVQA
jgi:hypothetical protein